MCDLKRKGYAPLSFEIVAKNSRDSGRRGALCTRNALRNREDRLALIPDRSVPAILSRTPKANLLFSYAVSGYGLFRHSLTCMQVRCPRLKKPWQN